MGDVSAARGVGVPQGRQQLQAAGRLAVEGHEGGADLRRDRARVRLRTLDRAARAHRHGDEG
eukprot:6488799-Prymnesium_polylepis.1